MNTHSKTRQSGGMPLVDEGAASGRQNLAHVTLERRNDFDVIVIGGGQAGLSVAHQLARSGTDFVVLDAAERIGDAWRSRWDSLRLFTPALYDGLDGMPFPAARSSYPSKDAMADYLADYAAAFSLPVLSGMRVDKLSRDGDRFVVNAAGRTLVASQVVIAMSNYQRVRRPAFGAELAPDIRQLDAQSYRNPGQMADGPVLIVGAANSGAEIAKDIAQSHTVIVAGRAVSEVPLGATSFLNRHVLVHVLNRVVFPHVLSIGSPIGRRKRASIMRSAVPLIRVKARDLEALGVRRVARIDHAHGGRPALPDGSTLDVGTVIWCTGFSGGFDWIDIPELGDPEEPQHDRGVVTAVPGLYFVGLHFLTSLSSAMVHGVGRDASRIAGLVSAKAVSLRS